MAVGFALLTVASRGNGRSSAHPNVVAIPGAASVAQLEQNAAAELELAAAEIQALDSAADFSAVGQRR